MSLIRILLVDDFKPFRDLVRSILQRNSCLRVIGEAGDGLEAVKKAKELRPDVILLDVGLPKLNGVEAARRILQATPQCKILFLSQESSPAVVQEALNLGARAYILKTQASGAILTAVDAVFQDKQFVSDTLADNLFDSSDVHAP